MGESRNSKYVLSDVLVKTHANIMAIIKPYESTGAKKPELSVKKN